MHDQELEEFPVAHQDHTITATGLVPLPEPKHGTNFFRGEAALGKLLPFSESRICAGSHLTLFVNRVLYIHLAILLLEWVCEYICVHISDRRKQLATAACLFTPPILREKPLTFCFFQQHLPMCFCQLPYQMRVLHHLLLSSIVLLHCHDAVIVCSPGNPAITTSKISGSLCTP